jgi:ubiquinone/menaquinone biosynthesis C-methylase UbiE
MDARKLEFQNERFDLIVDKGTIDSILCADDAEVSAAKAISEISRTLISGGVFIMISHAGPEHREALLKVPSDHFIHYQYATVVKPRVDDSVDSKDDEVHYVYVAIKGKKK